VALAGAAVAQGDDGLAAQEARAAGEFQDQHLVQAGDGGEVERVEARHGREPGRGDAPLDRAALTVE
jgi:hypothetical protein